MVSTKVSEQIRSGLRFRVLRSAIAFVKNTCRQGIRHESVKLQKQGDMVFNPLVQFEMRMITAFVGHGDRYLVSQSFERGRNPLNEQKIPLLLSHYSSLSAAKNHRLILKEDKWAAIIDLGNGGHREKLLEMALATSRYLLYVTFMKDSKIPARMDRFLGEGVRRYVLQQTNWSPMGGETVRFNIELKYGEFFLQLKFCGEVVKEKL